MAEDELQLGVLVNASLDVAVIEEGRRLVALAANEPKPCLFPALAVILACSALEMALEGSLNLAEAQSRKGGRSAGLPYGADLKAIAGARRESLRWKMEHVPSVITEGLYSTQSIAPELIGPLRNLVDRRNKLIHGRGELTEWDVTVGGVQPELEPGEESVSAAPEMEMAMVITLADGSKIQLPMSTPWGHLWFAVTADEATASLDAVGQFIDRCIQQPSRGRP